jgi:hypothetical protein
MESLTLEQAYYAGELVAAVIVIISIFYLAAQVKQSTRATRLQTTHDMTTQFVNALGNLSHNEGLSNIYQRGMHDGLSNLNKDEQVRFILLLSSFFRSVDELHYQHAEAVLDEEVWEGMKHNFDLAFQYRGYQEVWKLRKGLHSKRVQKYYDEIVAQGPSSENLLYPDIDK